MKVFAKDVMQDNVKSVWSGLSLADLERRFVDDNVSGFPVVDNGTIRGVVTASDVLSHLCEERREAEVSTGFYDDDSKTEFASLASDWVSSEVGKRTDHLHVKDVMNGDVISVSSDTPLHEVAALMTEKAIHRVLVVDDHDLVGIISSLDIVRACGRKDVDISFTAPKILDF